MQSKNMQNSDTSTENTRWKCTIIIHSTFTTSSSSSERFMPIKRLLFNTTEPLPAMKYIFGLKWYRMTTRPVLYFERVFPTDNDLITESRERAR